MAKKTRYFTFVEGSSSKFWKIDIRIDEDEDEYSFSTTYGKIGTDGQTTEKEFDSAEECEKEANKIIAQKVKKGYVESSPAGGGAGAKRYPEGESDDDYDALQEICEAAEDDELNPVVEYILKDPDLPNITDITIGSISEEMYDDSYQPIIDMFAENPEKFAHVDTLFIGDCEPPSADLDWLTHGDYSGLFKAMPQLKSLKIRGTKDLDFGGPVELASLTYLEIIGPGLYADVLKDLSKSKLPNLETLILYIGSDERGFDGDVSDVTPILSKKLFPKLRTLGLVNNEIEDEIAAAVMDSDVLPQLEELQLCYGTLSDVGGQVLLDNADKIKHLKKIDLSHHFMTSDMMGKLEALGKKLKVEIDMSDAEYDADEDDWKWILFTE